MHVMRLTTIAILMSWLCCAGVCRADAPSVSYIFPLGGQRGTTIDFHVGGHYLHDVCQFEMLGTGVEASNQLVRAEQTLWFEGPLVPLPESQQKEDYPWAQTGRVTIASEAPLGVRRWRVWTSQGVTESMKFVVGDFPEIIEDEVDGAPIPTHVTLPVTINGRMFPREDIDIWTFTAAAGTSYTCEVLANRLGSPLDSRLAVYGLHGKLIAENIDGRGVDSFLRFTADESGDYQVHIHDVNFAGLQHFVYRLTITDEPYVDRVYPLGGRRGIATEFVLSGQAVPSEPQSIALPSAGTSPFRTQLEVGGRTTNEITIELSDDPEVVEEHVDATATFALPVVMNGRIRHPGEVDSWWIQLAKGETVSLAVQAARLNSPLDSLLRIHDESGQELASNDDASPGQTDSSLLFQAPHAGRFRVTVQDTFASRGGEHFAYRLHAMPNANSAPDFELHLPVDALTVNRGVEVKLKVTALRKNQFAGAIELSVDGLPAGVTISNQTIAAQKNDTQLTFHASASAKLNLTRLKLHGTSMIGETAITRTAIKPADSWDDIAVEQLSLAVAIPTPFKVIGEFETRYAARGSTYLRHFTIDRGGYEGPLTVRMAERQVRHLQGVTGPTILVPAGETEFDYPITLPPWMEIGRTSRTAVMAVADVTDTEGSTHRVSYTSHAQNDQVIVLVDPGQLDVRLGRKSLVAVPQSSQSLAFQLGRGQGIAGPIEVRVIIPAHMRGLTVEPVVVPGDVSEGELQLHFADGVLGPWNMPLTVRAVASQAGFPYTAEATVTIARDERTSAASGKVARLP